jgi:hypothetical protein
MKVPTWVYDLRKGTWVKEYKDKKEAEEESQFSNCLVCECGEKIHPKKTTAEKDGTVTIYFPTKCPKCETPVIWGMLCN